MRAEDPEGVERGTAAIDAARQMIPYDPQDLVAAALGYSYLG